MNREQAFEEWYDEYFKDTQGEDSPFSYNDVKIAFYTGWKKQKVHNKNATNNEETERV